MLTKIAGIDWLGGHCLRIRFDDGSTGVHDFTAMVAEPGPVFIPLRAEAYFAHVFLKLGDLTWPNGCDIAPRWLRREMSIAGKLTPVAAESAANAS